MTSTPTSSAANSPSRTSTSATWPRTSPSRPTPRPRRRTRAWHWTRRERAADLTRDLRQMRRGALKAAGREGAALTIAATHALSFTFFPGWIRSFPLETLGTLNLVSDTMAACERTLLAGDAESDVRIKKGGALCLSFDGPTTGARTAALRWLLTPDLLRSCAPPEPS